MLAKFWIFSTLIGFANTFQCRNQEDEEVDWFAIYKLPTMSNDDTMASANTGYGFYYIDATHKKLEPTKVSLKKKNQALAYTLQQYYQVKENPKIFHVMYNDETPEESKRRGRRRRASGTQYGHTKGTVFFDDQSGVWLVHSVPGFPLPDHYEYPESGTRFGQSLLCVSLKTAQLSQVGELLYYMHPKIYSSSLPTGMAAKYSILKKVVAKKYQKGTPSSLVANLTTIAGQTFKAFAKSADFGEDLYSRLVAPKLHTSLMVETWKRGLAVGLQCSLKPLVLDIQTIKFPDIKEFSYTKDHSKLCISGSKKHPYVCIGGINRMTSQYSRGGETLCISDADVWKSYHNLISSTNEC